MSMTILAFGQSWVFLASSSDNPVAVALGANPSLNADVPHAWAAPPQRAAG